MLMYMGLITLSSAVPGRDVPQVVDDRLAHFVVFSGLGAAVLFWVAGFARERLLISHLAIAVLVVALFAVFDEWHQSFVPGRDSSLKDVGFDLAGAGTALALIFLAARRQR